MPTSAASALNTPADRAGDAQKRFARPATVPAGLLALGIVYGDLGTSPLYTLQTMMHIMGDQFTPEVALGLLSLVFWALIITISIKYCFLVMRADNHGEGGILALMTLTSARWAGRGRWLIIMGLFGAALIYGDGIITPAISVLSAVEGLNVATSIFKPYTSRLPLSFWSACLRFRIVGPRPLERPSDRSCSCGLPQSRFLALSESCIIRMF